MAMQKFAHIPKEYQTQQISWLRLSFDPLDTEGVYILLHKDLSVRSSFDYWFENADEALNWARKFYGINIEEWRTRESLEKEGINIINEM